MVYNLFIFLGSLVFVTLVHSEGRQPYDPSTVINVYPSLASLNNRGGGSPEGKSGDSDMDSDYCLDESCAASNVEPNWARKNSEKSSKAEEEPDPIATLPKSSHKHVIVKDTKKVKPLPKGSFSKDDTDLITHSSSPMPPKPILLLPEVALKPETSYQLKQPHDANSDEWNKVHNWSSFQDMLQLLRKRKH